MLIRSRKYNVSHTLRMCLLSGAFSSIICSMPAQAQLNIMGTIDTRPPIRPAPTENVISAPRLNQPMISRPVVPLNTGPSFDAPWSPQQPSTVQSPIFAPSINRQTPSQPFVNTPAENRTLFSADEVGFDRDFGVITARGNVEITYEGRVLVADTVSYNQNEDMVTASGNVQILESNGDVTYADFVEISADLRTGIVRQLRLSLADQSQIQGDNAKRTEGRFTVVEDGTYSPCRKCVDDPERPLTWKMTASEIQHDADQARVEYSDVFLKFYDVPVLYTPYFAHPDPTKKRETGFLIPSYGSQGSIGSFFELPYFIAINDQSDLTISPRAYFDERQGFLGLEYRQQTRKGEFVLAGTGTYADGGDGATSLNEEEFRGHINSYGLFDIDSTWRWGFDINNATDETYIRKYSIEDDSENSHLISDLYLEGFRHRNYANASFKIYQEQRDTTSDDLQNGKLELNYSHVGQPGIAGGYFKNDSSFYAINRKNNMQVGRLAFDTSYVIPHTSNGGDIYELSANLITTGYYVNNFNVSGLQDEYSGFQAEVVPNLNFSWRKPLTKSYLDGKVSEILEPVIGINIAPNIGQEDKIPNEDSQDFEFDDTNLFETNRSTGLDQLDGGQRIDYGFNWGIYGENGGYTQLFVGQSYRLREDSTYDTNSGLEDHLSDLVGRIDTNPSKYFDLLYRFRLDKDDLALNRSETNLLIGPDSSKLTLSHLYVEGTGDESEFDTREEVYAKLDNKISKYFSTSIDGRYRFSEPRGSVSYGGRLTYQDECLTIYGDFKREFFEDRDIDPEDSFTIRLELKNLGGIAAF